MPNTLACVFEILVSKCKINCTFKISAKAGIQKKSHKENPGFLLPQE
jgi:hypothetical protein